MGGDLGRRVKETAGPISGGTDGKLSVKRLRLGSASVPESARAREKMRMRDEEEEEEDLPHHSYWDSDEDSDSYDPSPPRTYHSSLGLHDRPQRPREFRRPVGNRLGGLTAGRTMGALDFLDGRSMGGRRGLSGPGGPKSASTCSRYQPLSSRHPCDTLLTTQLLSSLAVPTLDHYPSTLVSSRTQDLYRSTSTYTHRDFSPLFSVAFSHEAKRSGKQLLAISNEEGMVEFFDADKDAQWDRGSSPPFLPLMVVPLAHSPLPWFGFHTEHERRKFQAHQNAIFDVAWSQDDRQIVRSSSFLDPNRVADRACLPLAQATSSGDQTARVSDVETGQMVATLYGHRSSVKMSTWDPQSPCEFFPISLAS